MINYQEFKTSHETDEMGIERMRLTFPNGYTASVVRGAMLHFYPFAWEVAIIKNGHIDYTTPLTSDVEVFQTDEETNEFIEKIKNL